MNALVTDAAGSPDARMATAPPTEGLLLVLPWELHHPGGVNQVVQNLFDASQRVLGHRVTLLVNSWEQTAPHTSMVDGRRTIRARIRSPFNQSRPLRSAASYLLHLPRSLLTLRRVLTTEHVTRVGIHYPSLDVINWLLVRSCMARRPQVVLSFHGSDVGHATATMGLRRMLWSLILRYADDITVCSDQLKEQLQCGFPLLRRKARTVGNAVHPASVEAAATGAPRIQLPADFIICIATIEPYKGIDTLIAAFETVASSCPNVTLVMVGRIQNDAYFRKIRAMIAASRHAGRIIVCGGLPHHETMQLLARARVLILPSRQEAFGLVVLEAGVLGIPAIATSACGVVRGLRSGEELLEVPPDDPRSLAAQILRLLSNDVLAKELSRGLRKRVLQQFTWDHVAPSYYGLGSPPGSRLPDAGTRDP